MVQIPVYPVVAVAIEMVKDVQLLLVRTNVVQLIYHQSYPKTIFRTVKYIAICYQTLQEWYFELLISHVME